MARASTNAKGATAPTAEAKPNKARTLHLELRPGENVDRALAAVVAQGMATNASTVIRYMSREHEGLSLTDMIAELRTQGEAVNGNDLSALERTLTAQSLSLNAMFGELARIAHCNLFTVPDVAERYMRLALKAQSQSRATVETLAAIKNPPMVYARQANINNGGQQQVNNGSTPAHAANPAQARASAHPGETNSAPNELLEDATHGRTQLDTRATAAAGRTHQGLEPMGAVNRPPNR